LVAQVTVVKHVEHFGDENFDSPSAGTIGRRIKGRIILEEFMSLRISFAAVLGIFALPAAAGAEVIEGFNLTGDGMVTSSQLPLAPTTSDPSVSVGGLGVSANFDPGTVQVESLVGPDAIGSDVSSTPLYLDFSVTPDPGSTISVTTLDADIVYQNTGTVDILESTDGTFADAVQVATLAAAGSWTGTPTTFDLSGVSALQNIPSSQTTTFFVELADEAYNDRGISENNTTFQDGDALDILGTVNSSVPEPASLGLLAVSATCLMFRRRKVQTYLPDLSS
jgi:hypothetical protein